MPVFSLLEVPSLFSMHVFYWEIQPCLVNLTVWQCSLRTYASLCVFSLSVLCLLFINPGCYRCSGYFPTLFYLMWTNTGASVSTLNTSYITFSYKFPAINVNTVCIVPSQLMWSLSSYGPVNHRIRMCSEIFSNLTLKKSIKEELAISESLCIIFTNKNRVEVVLSLYIFSSSSPTVILHLHHFFHRCFFFFYFFIQQNVGCMTMQKIERITTGAQKRDRGVHISEGRNQTPLSFFSSLGLSLLNCSLSRLW